MRGPGDVSGLTRLLQSGALAAGDIVAILGKTEGNGGVNDFPRESPCRAFAHALAPHLRCGPEEVEARIAMVMSGGTEGVLSPHASVFTRRKAEAGNGKAKRLVVGISHTRAFLPEELGRAAQIDETARAVGIAMADDGIGDVSPGQSGPVKWPLLTPGGRAEAFAEGHR